jgi:L-fucose isomerase-like protein
LTAVLALSGGIEGDALRALAGTRGPVIIIAHQEANSLPASLEILARLRQTGRAGRIVLMRGEGWGQRLVDLARLAGVAASLRGARLGLIGEPSDWLVASPAASAALAETWGVELVPVPISELFAAYDAAAPGAADLAAVTAGATAIREPSAADQIGSARIYLALRQLVERHRLTAVTVRCFDLVTDRHATGCHALARLNEEGVVAGCEGDVPTALSMLLASAITGHPTFMANPADIDTDQNEILLAHCTIARTLTTSFALRSHFESGLGVAINGLLPNGPVSLLRIGGERLDRAFVAAGDLLACGAAEGLCRTQMRIHLTDTPAGRLLTEPLGNHHVVAFGDHAAAIRDFLSLYAPQVELV